MNTTNSGVKGSDANKPIESMMDLPVGLMVFLAFFAAVFAALAGYNGFIIPDPTNGEGFMVSISKIVALGCSYMALVMGIGALNKWSKGQH